MKQYHDLLQDILDNGIESPDRTGTGTYSVFGRQIRFDLSKGFPLLTTKKVHWKSVLVELLWLMRGETNIKFLNKHGVKIWDEWSRFVGDYPNRERLIDLVPIRDIAGDNYEGDFSTEGLNASRDSIEDKLRGTWVKMMKRCYCKDNHRYRQYGAIGIKVRKDWHDVKNFVEDVKKLTNWDNKFINWNDYELDKDYFNSDTYSKDTCVWLHTAENNLYTKDFLPFNLKLKNQEFLCLSLSHAEELTGIPRNTIYRWTKEGKSDKCDLKYRDIGFSFNVDNVPQKVGHVLRYLFTDGDLGPVYGEQWRKWKVNGDASIPEDGSCYIGTSVRVVDQLTDVINRIKIKPDCRRLIVSAWNTPMIPKMALPPCHTLFQFYVRNGKLSCQLFQRSADMFLGVPFNIASYATLTHLVANECGLQVGDFVHTFGDVHIYRNHLDQVKELLSRCEYPLPSIEINLPQGGLMGWIDDNVKDLSYDQIKEVVRINNYNSHDTIKAEVSV